MKLRRVCEFKDVLNKIECLLSGIEPSTLFNETENTSLLIIKYNYYFH